MRVLLAICFLLSLHLFSYAQITVEVNTLGSAGSNYGTVRLYDPSDITNKKVNGINYADMNGSPFWNDKWAMAFLYLQKGTIVKLKQVRMNLYTKEVHYIDNTGTELAAETGIVKKVVLLKAEDSTKILSVFEAHPDYADNKSDAYFRVLNNGKVQLLVLQKVMLSQATYNPLSGKQESGFFAKYYYAISNNGKITPLKAFNKDAIINALPTDVASETWLSQNRNKLKNETEVISFLDFYNGAHK